MNDNQEYAITKTIIITILLAFLGVLFFSYKVGACSSAPENCKDEFLAYQNGYNSHCMPGARAEVVNEPFRGIMCHCPAITAPANSGK